MFNNPYYVPYQYPYYQQNEAYKQNYQQPIQTNAQTQNNAQNANLPLKNDMIWVLNRNEADSYPVAPNCSVVLWDKNAPTIYVKSMSNNGIPSMRILDFTERTDEAQNPSVKVDTVSADKFVTLEQFNALKANFDDFKAMYEKSARDESKIVEHTETKAVKKTK